MISMLGVELVTLVLVSSLLPTGHRTKGCHDASWLRSPSTYKHQLSTMIRSSPWKKLRENSGAVGSLATVVSTWVIQDSAGVVTRYSKGCV